MGKNMKYIIGVLIFILGMVFGFGGTEIIRINHMSEEDHQREMLLELLEDMGYYYEDEEQINVGALRGMIEALNDPYSVYFDADDYDSFNSMISSQFAGIGVSIVNTGVYSIITKVIDDSPAEKSGIQIGDVLLEVDGTNLENKTTSEIAALIKGEPGVSRTIKIARDNLNQPLELNVQLASLTNPTVYKDVVEIGNQKIGYVLVTTFSTITYDEFEQAMNDLNSQNITDLIIDLRDNPGGSLYTVGSMLDYFIDTDQPLLYEKDRHGNLVPFKRNVIKKEIDYNISILINEYSASASEVFAATMNEIDKYDLIGKTTFGKGTVQRTYVLNEDETRAVKITTAQWLTPEKKWIQDVGVIPTIEVDLINYRKIFYLDASKTLKFDEVHQQIVYLQSFLNAIGYHVREDGYFDTDTLNAVKDYQFKKEEALNLEFDKLGIVDFKTIYYLNLDIYDYLQNKEYDEQYQRAIDYSLNN